MSAPSEQRNLRFRQLRLRRMPGFPHTGFLLDDLSPGLNVVFGPNASGKTTAARAFMALLWPTTAPPRTTSVWGQLRFERADWTIDLEAGHVACQRNGSPAGSPLLPPPEHASRYYLSLHELLRSADRPLAEAVLRESAGGYDVVAAARTLDYRDRASTRPSELPPLEDARKKLARAEQAQEDLRAEERELRQLEIERERADDAAARLSLLEQALERAATVTAERVARDRLAAFPEGMADLRPDDGERLGRLRLRLEATRAREREARQARDTAHDALASLALPEGGLPGELVATLRAELREVRDVEIAIRAREEEREKAVRQRDEAIRVIGRAATTEHLARLDHIAMEELADYAREQEQLNGHLAAAEAHRRWLGEVDVPEDLDAVRSGVDLLSRWLAADAVRQESRRPNTNTLASAGLAALSGLALAVLVHPTFLLVSLAAALLVWLDRPSRAGDPRPTYEREFAGLSLDPPASWTTTEAAQRRHQLERTLASGRLVEEKALRWDELAGALDELEQSAANLDRRREELIDRLGVAPGTPGTGLYWLANRISAWQESHRQVVAAERAEDVARHSHAALLAHVREKLAPFGYRPASSAAELAGSIDDLERRRDTLVQLRQDRRVALGDIQAANREALALENECADVFRRLGLPPDSDALVRDWCERHQPFQDASQALLRAATAAESASAKLAALPDYDPELLSRDAQSLRRELEETRLAAGKQREIRDRIVQIRTRIDDAKKGHQLEDALAEVARREAALREARERDVTAVIGATLADFVQQESRDHARPHVFHRARELLARMTHGRYELDFEPGDPPSFRARDTLIGVGHALDELSSGTRVQLLLAVRVAFVEHQEHGVRLPILFDETLANSDDDRAEAIMTAILELCRDGRQLFYFTAQADEAGKWLALLERGDHAIPYRLIDLTASRRRGRATDLAGLDFISPPPARALPDPLGLDHAAYGKALDPPPIDPRPEAIGQTHLWFLLEDVDALHNLLALGIHSWGALQTLVKTGGSAVGQLTAKSYDRIAATARALQATLESASIGHGKPVDRAALLESGAVSDAFIDAATKLCHDLRGDAIRLLRAIEDGKLPRFQRSKISMLRDHLERTGYLDTRTKASHDEIRARALAAAAADVQAGNIDPEGVGRLLERLSPGPVPK